MKLFSKKEAVITAKDMEKQVEELNKKLVEQKKKESQKKQIEETEEIEDYETDEIKIEGDDSLSDAINKYIESNGYLTTINYIDSLKNELMIHMLMQRLQESDIDNESDEHEEQLEIEE